MRYLLFFSLLIGCALQSKAQDSVHPGGRAPLSRNDTARSGHPSRRGGLARTERRRVEFFRDTIRRERRKFDSTLFTNINVPTTGDYAEDLGKVYEVLNDVPGVTGSFVKLQEIDRNLDNEDSALGILKEKLYQPQTHFHVRNLQMFNTLLDALDRNTDNYSAYLTQYDTALDEVRKEIADLRGDTLMLQIFRDTALKNEFQPQLLQLKNKWRQVDSLVTENGKRINTLKSQASAHSITIVELLFRVDNELKAVGTRALGKESDYLWEATGKGSDEALGDEGDSLESQWQLAGFYFSITPANRNLLLLAGLLFFGWIWSNYRALKKRNRLSAIDGFHITFINAYPAAAALVFIFCLAPLFDLKAPSVYIETIQVLQMVVMTLLLWRRVQSGLFYGWCIFMLLFVCSGILRLMNLPPVQERWAGFLIDALSLGYGIYFLIRQAKNCSRWIVASILLYCLLNLAALLCNLYGRVTLFQILGATAIYSFAESASLAVFVQVIVESFMLQVQTSRIRKKYPEGFDAPAISKSIFRIALMLALVLWVIVFTTNLNLFDALNDLLVDFFSSNRQVGNFSFTLGGIFLFLGIIWLANFLQKYIAYFFGDTGDDAAFDDKGQRSRLMVTRLILLIAGFLLAVAASGLAVDRITVILGALGVGIGLGLQSIVNNFVSGVILIFDRPLRIGDTVDIGDKRGRVKEISIRTSTLLTEEGAEVIIPNGDILSHNIVNWTLSNNFVRAALSFTIDKPASLEDIRVNEIMDIVKKIPNVMEQRDPEILVNTVSSKSVELKILFWNKDFNRAPVTSSEVKTAIYEYLSQKGLVVD